VVKSGRLPDPEPQAFVSHIADAFLTTALRQAWILLPAANNAMELAAQLGARGWAVTRSCQSMGELLDAMSSTERGPELLFTGVRLPDGDAFELIRRLAARRHAPALFFVTRQQRAVIKAAVSLCEHYGLTVAGQALAPMNIELVLRQIELFRLRERRAASPRKLPPVPQIDQLEEFVLKDGVRAFLQPKLRLSSGQVVGFESLMRAIGPDGQIIHPQALIEPLAAAGLLPAATLQMFSQTVAIFAQVPGRRHRRGRLGQCPLEPGIGPRVLRMHRRNRRTRRARSELADSRNHRVRGHVGPGRGDRKHLAHPHVRL